MGVLFCNGKVKFEGAFLNHSHVKWFLKRLANYKFIKKWGKKRVFANVFMNSEKNI